MKRTTQVQTKKEWIFCTGCVFHVTEEIKIIRT